MCQVRTVCIRCGLYVSGVDYMCQVWTACVRCVDCMCQVWNACLHVASVHTDKTSAVLRKDSSCTGVIGQVENHYMPLSNEAPTHAHPPGKEHRSM